MGRYTATITSGSLKIPESRRIADLLLRGIAGKDWTRLIVDDNILQAKSPVTARSWAKMIRARLETMNPELWTLVRDGQGTVATHAVFAASVKHSPLLGDFLDLVVADQHRQFAKALSPNLFDDYLTGCRERDLAMPEWNETTRSRLRSSVFQMLAQAGYIKNTAELTLQPVHVAEQVLRYLRQNREDYVLRCMQVSL